MSYPTSKVAICNLALDHLNEAPITSIDSPTTQVESLLSRWYDLSRRAVLKLAAWNFATKRTTISSNVVAPAFGDFIAYDLPNDFVNVQQLGENGLITDYRLEGNQLLINTSQLSSSTATLKLLYTYDFTSISQMDALFIETLALHIALKIGNRITNNASLLQALDALYKDALDESRRVDGQQSKPRRFETSRFRRARLNNRTAAKEGYVNFGEF